MDKYLQYTITDFVADESFIAWTRGDNSHSAIWESFLKDHPEKRSSVEEAQALILNLKFDDLPKPKDAQEKIWEAIISETDIPKSKSIYSRTIPYMAAAMIALVLYFTVFNTDYKVVKTYASATTVTELPDGSEVYSNANTIFQYKKAGWSDDKRVELDGEAFFDVEKGASFVVETDYGEVSVLGTTFNVYARNQRLEVSCETGKVRVSTEDTIVLLTPGMTLYAIDHKVTTQSDIQNQQARGSWRFGEYHYQDKLLSYVLQDIERVWKVNIELPIQYDTMRYTGQFNKKDKDIALKAVLWPLNLEYYERNDSIIIR